MVWDALFIVVGLLWLAGCVRSIAALRSVRRLPAAAGDPDGACPAVTVVIAARDEADRIVATVGRVLAQRGVDLRVVVVDDRSTDGTGDAAEAAFGPDRRVRVVRVGALPEAWLGKCNALHTGAAGVTDGWVLFMDADSAVGEDVVARSIAGALAAGADHATLIPGFVRAGRAVRPSLAVFWIALIRRAVAVNAGRRGAYIGVGAFNLVRAESYRRIGGHEALRMEVLDDLKLGLLVGRAGGRTAAFAAERDLLIDYGATIGELVGVLEKNHFALLRYNFWLWGASTAALTALGAAPIAGVVRGGAAGWFVFVCAALLVWPGAVASRRLGWGVVPGLLAHTAIPVMLWAAAHSAYRTTAGRGVRWRKTFYPIADLRRGLVK